MGSSHMTTLAMQRNIPGKLCIAILVMMVLDQGVLVQTSIEGLTDAHTARVGEDVAIAFEYCAKSRPFCDPMSFNLSSPNSACTLDRHGHCQLQKVSEGDPRRQTLPAACELCEVVVHGVTQADAGLYSICQEPAPCTSAFWRILSTLGIENEEPSTVNPPGLLIESTTRDTTPNTTPTKSTSETNFTPKLNKSSNNASHTGMKLSSAVGIPVTFIIIIIVIIVGAVYFYKKRTGRRQQDHTALPQDVSVNTIGNTTTVNISLKSQDGCSIAIVNEDTALRADPE